MKKQIFALAIGLFISLSAFSQTEKIIGKWKTFDDKDNSAKSVVHIFKSTNGKYYGKIEKLFKNPGKLCAECEGNNKDKPVLGLLIITNMTDNNGTLSGGTILDPKNGKIYYCTITYDATTDKLQVRGSLDKKGWVGRSQVWIREDS